MVSLLNLFQVQGGRQHRGRNPRFRGSRQQAAGRQGKVILISTFLPTPSLQTSDLKSLSVPPFEKFKLFEQASNLLAYFICLI